MNTNDERTPWGAVIDEARKQMRPKLSATKAAEQSGISEGRWRQIVLGYQSSGGVRIPVQGPADTVARMAETVGVTPEQMIEVGRADVAEEMSRLQSVGVLEDGTLWVSDNSEEEAELLAWLRGSAGDRSARPPTRSLLLWDVDQLLEAAGAKHHDEMRLLNHLLSVLRRREPEEVKPPARQDADPDVGTTVAKALADAEALVDEETDKRGA